MAVAIVGAMIDCGKTTSTFSVSGIGKSGCSVSFPLKNFRQASVQPCRQARRSPPHLRNFDVDSFTPQRHSYFRLDNSRSPTWSILGDFFCGGDTDRTIINVPSKLLHLVTYDNNSPPGCTFRENDDDDYDSDNDDYDNIICINFHYSDSDSFILSKYSSCYDDTSDDDLCYDDTSDDDDSNNIYENTNINNKSCTY